MPRVLVAKSDQRGGAYQAFTRILIARKEEISLKETGCSCHRNARIAKKRERMRLSRRAAERAARALELAGS
jgi:hypothetical protein